MSLLSERSTPLPHVLLHLAFILRVQGIKEARCDAVLRHAVPQRKSAHKVPKWGLDALMPARCRIV